MVLAQIERLKSDLTQIENFAKQLKKEGKVDLSKKVWTKRDFLEKYIQEVSA